MDDLDVKIGLIAGVTIAALLYLGARRTPPEHPAVYAMIDFTDIPWGDQGDQHSGHEYCYREKHHGRTGMVTLPLRYHHPSAHPVNDLIHHGYRVQNRITGRFRDWIINPPETVGGLCLTF